MKKRWSKVAVVGAFVAGLTAGVVGGTSTSAGAAEEPTWAPMYWVGDAVVVEGDQGTRLAKVTVTFSEPLPGPAVFTFRTVDTGGKGAEVKVDHPRVNRQVRMPAGKLTKTLSLPIFGDTVVEGDELVVYELVPLDAPLLAAGKSSGTALISDDDEPSDQKPTISVSSARVFEGSSGWRNERVAFTLSRPQGQDLRVMWQTVPSTATPGEDFVPVATRTTTIRAGRTQATGQVKVFGDTDVEQDEIVDVVILGVSGGDGQPFLVNDGLLMIADDDADLDGDQLPDAAEWRRKIDPANPDSDEDGLWDGVEVRQLFTSPSDPDTDGDGFNDLAEVDAGTNPLDPSSHP
jgi:hypothetical protein